MPDAEGLSTAIDDTSNDGEEAGTGAGAGVGVADPPLAGNSGVEDASGPVLLEVGGVFLVGAIA
jgi:hypothetical protein